MPSHPPRRPTLTRPLEQHLVLLDLLPTSAHLALASPSLPSRPNMGVKELGKFLKTRSPSSVTQYTSLVPFRGKRFAIDANLLTTKFHYANAGKFTPGTPLGTTAKPLADHHPAAGHSHARAWYWFLEALRKHGIHPIVVFDGDTRLAAKARENERRRDARALQGARAAAEGGRGARLREVEAVFGAVSEEDRPAVVEGFRRVVEDTWGDVGGGGGEPVRPVAAPARAEPDAAAAAAVEQQAWLARLDALLAQQQQDAPPLLDVGPDVAPVEPPPLEAASPAIAAGLDAVRRQDLEQAPPPLVPPAPDSESTASAPLEPSLDAPHPSPLANHLGPDASPTEPAVEQQAFLARLDARLAQQQQDAPSLVDVGPDVAPVEPPPLEAASPAIAAGLDAVRRQDLEQAPPPLVPTAPDSESTASAPLEPWLDAPHPSPLANPLGPDASPTEPASSALSPSLSTASPTSPPLPLGVTPSPSVAAALAAARLAQSHKLTSLAGPAASHGPIVAHIVALATLFAEYRADALNPVYSRNQVRVTHDEGRFFEGLLREGTPAEAAATAAAAAAVFNAASEDERALGDDKNERVLGEPAEEEEPPAPPTRDVELADIIAQSDKFFVSHTKRSDAPPRAAFREVRVRPLSLSLSLAYSFRVGERALTPSPIHLRSQRLVAALGVPFLEPSPLDPHEAEGVCAALCTLGHADYVVSEDTDVAVYGAPLLRSVTVTPAGTGREAARSMSVLDPVRLREDLGLTNEEFVDFALLCGTDFTDRVNK